MQADNELGADIRKDRVPAHTQSETSLRPNQHQTEGHIVKTPSLFILCVIRVGDKVCEVSSFAPGAE
jgi:hypothetical protein